MGNARNFEDARLARLREVLSGYVDRGEVPGFITVVSRHGETRVEVAGKLAIGGRPLQRDDLFRISSMSKVITAVAAMILIEECKLRLDEPVDRLLPELADRRVLERVDGPVDRTVKARRAITVRDVLTFRLGYGMLHGSPESHPVLAAARDLGFSMGPPAPQQAPAPDEWIRRLGQLPLMYQPGERWMYHTGAEVLGVLIARAAAMPFDRFLQERLFEPLGMRDTSFWASAEQRPRLTTSYLTNPETGQLIEYDKPDGQWTRAPAFPNGADGLLSTADDQLRFAQMLLNGGKLGDTRILSRPAVELMTTDHLTPEQKAKSALMPGDFEFFGYGFGVSVITRRDHLFQLGTYGWDGGLGTSLRIDPVEQTVTLLLTQAAWSSPQPPNVCLDFWTLAYQALA